MSFKFSNYLPTKIIFSDDSINKLSKIINNNKVLLISTQGNLDRGIYEKLNLKNFQIVEQILNISSHPEIQLAEDLYKKVSSKKFDMILAVGGGSVIDIAKVLSVSFANKKTEISHLIKNPSLIADYSITPVIAIPTTSGTGSEVTPYATLWDSKKTKKYSLSLIDLHPAYAIFIPELTLTLSKEITIQTGLDALSHSLESIWNKNANPISLRFSIQAAKLILDSLSVLINRENTIDLRSKMQLASLFAGLAISNTQTAISHAVSYYITTKYNISHGIACSFLIPDLIDKAIGKYDFIDEAFIEIFGELSSKKIRRLYKEIEAPSSFSDLNITDSEITEIKNYIRNNPRALNTLVHL